MNKTYKKRDVSLFKKNKEPDKINFYFQCLIEEYKQCKNEIDVLQKYSWRVQMYYVPTLLITFLGFYIKDIWSIENANNVSFSVFLNNLFSDHAFLTLILWSAVISILIVLFTGNMMIKEGRYLTTWLIPAMEKLLNRENVFMWEKISTEQQPISKHFDDSFQLYGDIFFGTLLMIIPIIIALVTVYFGFTFLGEMNLLTKLIFLGAVLILISCIIAGLVAFIMLKIRKRRSK